MTSKVKLAKVFYVVFRNSFEVAFSETFWTPSRAIRSSGIEYINNVWLFFLGHSFDMSAKAYSWSVLKGLLHENKTNEQHCMWPRSAWWKDTAVVVAVKLLSPRFVGSCAAYLDAICCFQYLWYHHMTYWTRLFAHVKGLTWVLGFLESAKTNSSSRGGSRKFWWGDAGLN